MEGNHSKSAEGLVVKALPLQGVWFRKRAQVARRDCHGRSRVAEH